MGDEVSGPPAPVERGRLGTVDAEVAEPASARDRLDPAVVKDQDELDLDLIDYGLEEMGESTGEKGEAQLVTGRCNAFPRISGGGWPAAAYVSD